MRADQIPSTTRMEVSPALAANETGVVLTGPAHAQARRPLVLHGMFRIPRAAADEIGDHLHRALVLVVTTKGGYHASNPLRHLTTFADDETSSEVARQGWFNLDAWATCPFEEPGTYFVTVSLGPYLSNTLEIQIA